MRKGYARRMMPRRDGELDVLVLGEKERAAL